MRKRIGGGVLLLVLGGCAGGSPDDAVVSPDEPVPAACMSDTDQAMLQAVNAARAEPRRCGTSTYAAAAPLRWSCSLAGAARTHSNDMAHNNFFNHTGSNGLSVGDRATAAGYAWRSIAENIAAGQRSVDAAMQSWLGSAGHCANIMNPDYVDLGASSVTNSGSNYRIYWTQVFGRPR